MTSDQHGRKITTLKEKPFHEENNDNKIGSRVPSRMKRTLFVDINAEGSLTVKSKLIILTNFRSEEGQQIHYKNMI